MRRSFLVLLLILLGTPFVQAQMTGPAPSSMNPTPISGAEKTGVTISPDAMVFEGAVDPATFYLGPGDVLQLRLWHSSETVNIPVSPEQVLIVPRVGEFNVAGKTLAEVKDEVYAKAAQIWKGESQPISLTLLQPGKIWVKVHGDVLTPDVYTLTSATRADVAVDLANKPRTSTTTLLDEQERRNLIKQQQEEQRLRPVLGTNQELAPSLRYITVSHTDGTFDRADLVRYNATHDPKASPFLRQGDVIYVPYRDPNNGTLGIYGEVQAPGEFEYVKGDSLSSLIRYAFGPTVNADLHHVQLTRILRAGEYDTRDVDAAAILAKTAPDIPLNSGDRVFVRGTQSVKPAAVAYVHGEVARPGVYPIVNSQTKLSELVRAAGGLTSDAAPAQGEVFRRGPNQRTIVGSETELNEITRLSNFGTFDTANFHRQMAARQPTVVVDMSRLFLNGDSSADITLQDGDEVVIPPKPTQVYVYGFVNNSGFVSYSPNAPLSYYISQAGGYAEGAVRSGTRVIKAKTKAWLSPSDTQIEAGDEIYVPKESDYSQEYSLQLIGTLGALAMSVLGLALGVYNTFKK